MDLSDYPRPPNDTGIGVHWTAGYPAPNGLGVVKDRWLPELRALGVKWVKIARGDGGVAFDELLLANGLMPIVRLYRPQPNPGTLDENQVRQLKEHVAAGVRYFEFNNEPDLGHEWANGALPPNGPEVVARNAIRDMETILAAGGYPGIPAVAIGCRWDLAGEICRQGRRDLLREGVWQAVHNYSLNHPLDYPYDGGNQRGEPYSREFFDHTASRQSSVSAWSGRSLEQVNAERRGHANPGATTYDDASCWRAYERFDQLIRAQLGRSIPILATEDGYVVGERFDTRYPATTPDLHLSQTLEACRCLMGSSTSYARAPDWFFCSAFWLLGNYALGHYASEWEGAAWYSSRWPSGQLPIVAALKAEPKTARAWHGDGGELACRVSGNITNGQAATLRLARGNAWAETAPVAADGSYAFSDVPPGRYTLSVVQAPQFEQEVVVSEAQPEARVDFNLTGVGMPASESVLSGTVKGGAGLTLLLARPADGWTCSQPVATGGSYRFTGLGQGTYSLVVDGTDIARAGILLDGRNAVNVDLVYPGWAWQLNDGGVSPGFGVVRCRVKGRPDVALRLWADGWSGMVQRTGSKLQYGPDACEFAPLGSGKYMLQPLDGTIERLPARPASFSLDGSRVVWITYTEPEGEASGRDSLISGHVKGGAGLTVFLSGPSEGRQAELRDDEAYRFAALGAGTYRLEVMGAAVDVLAVQDGIALDGQNQVTVDLQVTPLTAEANWTWRVEEASAGGGSCVVRCRVKDRPGLDVHLSTDGWSGLTQKTGSKAEYGPDACEFAPLGPGSYLVEVEELDVRAEIHLTAGRLNWVCFEPRAGATPAEGTRVGPSMNGPMEATTGVALAPSRTSAPPKLMDHYLLVGDPAGTAGDFLAVLRYVKRFRPPLGNDPDQAQAAQHVTILGAADTIGRAVEERLRAAGCKVQRIESDYAERLGKLLTADAPY